MSSESPVVEIFSSDGIELPVQNGVATPTNTRAIIIAGSDGANSRFLSTNTSGQLIISGTVANTQSAPWIDNITQFGGVNISTGTGASGTGIPRVTVSNDSNIIITAPTLTKGTQAATGLSVQNLKDAGRSIQT